jgi:hypothetical protein
VDAKEEAVIAKGLRDVKVSNITPEVVRKFKKYASQAEGGMGLRTPLRNGKPMTAKEAMLAGSLQGNKADLTPSEAPRPAVNRTGKGGSAYDDTGAVRFSNED